MTALIKVCSFESLHSDSERAIWSCQWCISPRSCRRRIGHWLTDVSELWPLLALGQHCRFTLQVKGTLIALPLRSLLLHAEADADCSRNRPGKSELVCRD